MASYLVVYRENAPQREHSLRAVFNGLRSIVRSGAHWRMMPNELPPRSAVYQQARRWLQAGCFESMGSDLRVILRELNGRPLPSTQESGGLDRL